MKILKVERLNYARFHNFAWDHALPLFSNSINILFGWNGSGKTTFSRVIRMLESGVIGSSCTFKIKTDSTDITETSNLSTIKGLVRVFNTDYIEETLRGSSTIPYIFFAGKDAVSYEDEEKKLETKRDDYAKIVLPTTHDDIAKRTAIVIKEVAGINSIKKQLIGAGTYASYDKTDFEKRIINIKEQINKGKVTSHADFIRKDIEDLKSQLVNTEHLVKNNGQISNAAQWLLDNVEHINKVLQEEPIQIHSKRIDSLEDSQKTWIKQGIDFHFSSEKPLEKCLFCNSKINNTDELIKHFSDEVVRTINLVDEYSKKIEAYTTDFAKLDSLTGEQQQNVDFLRSIFDSLTITLQEKRNSISTKKSAFVIDNKRITSLSKPKAVDATSIAYAIETHFVAQQYDEYVRAKDAYDRTLKEKTTAELEILQLDEQVKILKQKVKNTHEPAQALNHLFKIVFPYRKIEIADSDDGKGYRLKRDGSNCSFNSLSEGEKNFISLAYFIYSLNDAQNKLSDDGIVMIDDPVSSLDKQSIFQIFSIIVNEIQSHTTRQYLISTHNLDFFGHLREHFRKQIDRNSVGLFNFAATSGSCVINSVHPLLKDHRSDYYYVFSVLAKYKDACNQEDAYLIVNLLRRWLETFLEFKFSTSGDLKSTLQMAYSTAAKETEKFTHPFLANHLEMYRFINHGSHGFTDPESIDESILNGAHERIGEAFRLVEILDNLHYKKLQGIITV